MDRQCSSCGGFCKKSGCERENVKPKEWQESDDLTIAYMAGLQRGKDLASQRSESSGKPSAWVGLTDEERRSLREWQKIQEELGPVWAPMMLYLYESIEAKLKEKNT